MGVVALDFETANPKRSSVCAVGIASVDGLKLLGSTAWLIRPRTLEFSPFNVGLHGITPERVELEPEFDAIWPKLWDRLRGNLVIAHNASFDISVLRKVLDEYGLPHPELEYLCTLHCARRVWPDMGSFKLNHLASRLGIPLRHHDPEDDAVVCAKLAVEACRLNGVQTIRELAERIQIKPGRLDSNGHASCRLQPKSHEQSASGLVSVSGKARGRMRRRGKAPARSHSGAISQPTLTSTASGLVRCQVEVEHLGLNKYQVIRGDDPTIVQQKARAKLLQWEDAWNRRQTSDDKRRAREEKATALEAKKMLAADKTREAAAMLAQMRRILADTLDIDDTVDWEALKDRSHFAVPRPPKPKLPAKPRPPELAPEPSRNDARYTVTLNLRDKLFRSRRKTKEGVATMQLERDHKEWKEECKRLIGEANAEIRSYNNELRERERNWTHSTAAWREQEQEFLADQARRNEAIDEQRQLYMSGDPSAVVDYCDIVLSSSQYPTSFPQTFDLDYIAEENLLDVEYQLPSPESVPTVCEVRYVKSQDALTEKHVSQRERDSLYDAVVYQIVLRTVHELFEADAVAALETIVLNGFVNVLDQGTGHETTRCVVSLRANRQQFESINLASIDPKACLEHLGGQSSAAPHKLKDVKPTSATH